MDIDVDVTLNDDGESIRKTGGSIIKGREETAPYSVDADVYLSLEEVRVLMRGEKLYTEQFGHYFHIRPPDMSVENNNNRGHYDDTLVALEEMFYFIEQIEGMAPGLLRYTEKDKLKNTYLHYKKQQDRYQQTNK